MTIRTAHTKKVGRMKKNNNLYALNAFDSLLRVTPNMTVIVGKDTRVIYLSNSMAKFIKYKNKEHAIDQPLVDLLENVELKYIFADILDKDGFFETVIDLEIDGEKKHFKVIKDKLSAETGGSFIDITDISAVVKSEKAARDANKSKSAFLAAMSHEIRTPMNVIIGIAQIELQKEGIPEQYAKSFDRINNSGNVLLGIINDILDMSKIETGKMELNPVNYDMPSLISDTVQLNTVRMGSKKIEFVLEIDPSLPSRMIGDEIRIKQILNNLLSNAIKYTEIGEIRLSVSIDGDFLCLTVSDSGQGIKEDDQKKLFSEYVRFNSQANREIEGTGIGLRITKNLTDMMGGTIEVDSKWGKGSVFKVRLKQERVECLPIGEELAKSLEGFTFVKERQKITAEEMSHGSVLIVDDVETNLYVAEGLMSPYKLNISTVNSGFAAIKKVESGENYDIIFMDHMMPLMDGIETTQKLRAMGYKGTIVALTANALAGNDAMFKKKGFDDFISKPIDVRHLNVILKKYVKIENPLSMVLDSNPKILQIFKKDAIKALKTIRETKDLKEFTTSVHAMKSALANVGENDLSDRAAVLEELGFEGDAVSFAQDLEKLIESIESPKSPALQVNEDRDYLRRELEQIKAACEKYDTDSVISALDRLKVKPWNQDTVSLLEEIRDAVYVFSDFEKAIELINS